MFGNLKDLDVESFSRTFKKKLRVFLEKAPIVVDNVEITNNIVNIKKINSTISDFKYTIDYSITADPVQLAKINIFNIKQLLVEEFYPTFKIARTVFSDLSPVEREDLQETKGYSLEAALKEKKRTTIITEYKILRVLSIEGSSRFNDRNRDAEEIFIKNIATGEMGRFELKLPNSIFLKRLRNDWTPEEAGEVFLEKSKFLNRTYTEEVWNQYKTTGIKLNDYYINIID